MDYDANPFPEADSDRYELWEMLVRRDIEAFLRQDWAVVADDFLEEEFMGIDGRGSGNPDSWRLSFPDLSSYKESWLEQSAAFSHEQLTVDARQALFDATTLRDIEIRNDSALLHKKFDGTVPRASAPPLVLNWQSLYRCRKVAGRWRIAGFVGYLPNPAMSPEGSGQRSAASAQGKSLPTGARQHAGAGPYSPILEVRGGSTVVISGQAAIDPDGSVTGTTIEEQGEHTLRNCERQLRAAGCGLEDVFKVNIYMKDLDEWSRFNEVYREIMPEPRPVRTAVQCGLLPGLLVEIEMWAVKPS